MNEQRERRNKIKNQMKSDIRGMTGMLAQTAGGMRQDRLEACRPAKCPTDIYTKNQKQKRIPQVTNKIDTHKRAGGGGG